MQVAVERRPGSVVALTITVEPTVLQQRMEQLFHKHARRVTIPGFRPGKAPRRLLEERINPQVLKQEAIEEVIDATYKDALAQEKIEPLERGEIDDLKTEDDDTLIYTVLVSARPEITLPEYRGIEITQQATQVTDEQVSEEIERLRERTADFSDIEDDGIQTGDYVTIDYTMKVDGEAYPEGDTTGYPLEVGSDTFFPELNEGLLGVKKGDTTTISTNYAEDYSNKDLAGKTAEFSITVQQVRRMVKPEAGEEWVKLISQGAMQSMDDLSARIKQNLQAMASQSDHEQIRNTLVSKIVEQSTLDLPDTLVEEELKHLMGDLEHRLSHEHLTLDDYAKTANTTVDDIKNEQQVLARDIVRRSLILQEIARREGLFVTDEDINNTLAVFAQEGKSVKNIRKELERSGRLDSLASRLFHEKVLGFLEANAKIEIEGQIETPAAEEASAETPESTTDTTE